MSSFLLGGRAWVVDHVIHTAREVHVRAAPAGKKPTWGGFMPRFLGREVCQRIRSLLEGEEELPYLDESATRELRTLREDLGPLLRRASLPIQVDSEGSALWWNFAGGRINHTFKYALEATQGWKVVPDNFFLKISGEVVTHLAIEAALSALAQPSFWSAPGRMQSIRARIPPYRLSKFQDALPPSAEAEMLGAFFLDVPGACELLGSARLTH
ncbi:hypothetical protein JQX13_34445 [Archangium violaceum]|uniref:hypothetical protein n=1 Tax=Archangium violaceum TaxID=83451 RepID=UPI00193BAF23|nr:hypothetical protein [Archangium violaceum]QRK05268.1 hypothetical protein JQX13_34445 [Archangium violaceum]